MPRKLLNPPRRATSNALQLAFDESKHPRQGGKFTSSGGGGRKNRIEKTGRGKPSGPVHSGGLAKGTAAYDYNSVPGSLEALKHIQMSAVSSDVKEKIIQARARILSGSPHHQKVGQKMIDELVRTNKDASTAVASIPREKASQSLMQRGHENLAGVVATGKMSPQKAEEIATQNEQFAKKNRRGYRNALKDKLQSGGRRISVYEKNHLKTRFNAAKLSRKPEFGEQALYLAAADDFATETVSDDSRPTAIKARLGDKDQEIPVAYLDKDVAEVGDYVHPITGQSFSIDEARLDHWAETVNGMIAAGLEIPTPADHVETQMARSRKDCYVPCNDNVGFVVGAKRVGKRLRLTQQAIGMGGLEKALRNRASIYVLPEYTDEKGRKWKDCIVHSAYTPMPVLSGMGSFVPLAASRGEPAKKLPVFQLARETGVSTMNKSKQQGLKLALAPERLDDLRQWATGTDGGMTVADAAAATEDDLLNAFFDWYFAANPEDGSFDPNAPDAGGAGGAHGGGMMTAPPSVALSRANARIKELEGKLELSRGGGVAILDDELAMDRLADVFDKIDEFVETKRIKPTQATNAKLLLQNGEEPNHLMLARNGGQKYPAQVLLAILGENEAPDGDGKPIKGRIRTGGMTGSQNRAVALSRQTGADDPYSPEKAQEKAKEYAERNNKKK